MTALCTSSAPRASAFVTEDWNVLPSGAAFWLDEDEVPTKVLCDAKAKRADVERELVVAIGARLRIFWEHAEVAHGLRIAACVVTS